MIFNTEFTHFFNFILSSKLFQAYEIRRQALQKKIQKNRQRLDDLNCERQSLEQVIERTAQLYQQSHLERRHMIDTWHTAVQSLYMRDITIQETIEVNHISQQSAITK